MSIQEKTEEENNVVHLSLIQGGRLPPKKGDNWLEGLNQYAFFVARTPLSRIDGFLFHVKEKYDNTTLVSFFVFKEELGKAVEIPRYVITKDFSDEYELMDVLDYGQSDRSDLDRRLEVNADIEQDDTMA